MSDPVPVQRELIKSSPPGGRRGIFYVGRFALNLYDGLCSRLRWELAIEMLTSTTCIRTMVSESEYDIDGSESTESFLEIELVLA
jgi:hypothetical protein